MRQRQAGPGVHAFVRSVGKVLSGAWAMVGLVNTNQNSRVFVRSKGSYLGCKEEEGSGRQVRLHTRAVGEIMLGSYIYCDSVSAV